MKIKLIISKEKSWHKFSFLLSYQEQYYHEVMISLLSEKEILLIDFVRKKTSGQLLKLICIIMRLCQSTCKMVVQFAMCFTVSQSTKTLIELTGFKADLMYNWI